MKQPAPHDALQSATVVLQQAVGLLVKPSPSNLERSEALLAEARRCLEFAAAQLPGPHSPSLSRRHLEVFQDRLRNFAVLLDHSVSFHAGWIRTKNSLVGGYTSLGEPAAPALPPGRLSVEG